MTTTTLRRLSAGNYVAVRDGDEIAWVVHIRTPDMGDGYGRRDHWIIAYTDGGVSDPYATLGDARTVLNGDTDD